MGGILTQADVQRLITSPSSDVRAATAIKVSQAFSTADLSDAERELAKQILRVMAKDAEAIVRGALADHLKASSELPRDVAIALARDIESVSLPVLEFSAVLSDADLIEIVRTASAEKQQAVAQRESVSSELANALIDHSKNAAVVAALMRNRGADLGEAEYKKALDKHGEDMGVTNAVLGRGQLPITIAERLVNVDSERLHDFLID